MAYKSELEAADNPAAMLEEIKARLDKVTSPFRSAERFNVEDIIDPRDTRRTLGFLLETVWETRHREVRSNSFGIARM